ncbi:MAG TPA: antitoxin Xre/MbcA/ParS toxin-binding domain-containing protein [Gemmatimonadaceae bacterium]|nr:antitoxin Xre/MbcA/ParS toxin-binding domain-containing protein [Gemmatimonadaceae bacterium]
MDILGETRPTAGRWAAPGSGPGGVVRVGAGQLRARIRGGLPYRAFDRVRERLQLSLPEAAAVLNVPLRTLARRRIEKKLAADESDRLYRLARVAAHAVDVLGTDEKVAAWFRRSNRALGGESPLQILDTDLGTRQVEDVLGRLEHGSIS